jgi:carbon monoxide dehydrogenase subunit G
MASVREEFVVTASPDHVWAAIRDVGAADRVFGGVLTASRPDGDGARVVTFASGAVVRELIIDIDDDRRRVAYTAVDGPLGATHHNAALQILPADDGYSHVVWVTDVLPHALAGPVGALMRQGAAAMQANLQAS